MRFDPVRAETSVKLITCYTLESSACPCVANLLGGLDLCVKCSDYTWDRNHVIAANLVE